MAGNPTELPVLDEAQAVFVLGPVSINIGSCSADLVPSVVRAHGCRVSDDRRRVTVFVSVPRAAALLDDLRAGGGVAAVFSRPKSHETLQLKGKSAGIVPLEAGDEARIEAYAERFIAEICALGFKEPFARGAMSSIAEESVGIVFEPVAAFVQTPGPQAGQRLEPKP